MINFLFLGATELIILVALVLLLFGGKKIPGLLKGIGSGIRGFKQEIKEDDKKKPADKEGSDNNSSQNQLEQ